MMGEIVERIAKSLARCRRERDENAEAIIRLTESGDFTGTHSSVVTKLWESAQKASDEYETQYYLIYQSFGDHAEDIIARSEEL